MANFWNIPKTLLSKPIRIKEKIILGVMLQYHNAGYADKITAEKIQKAIGEKCLGTLHKMAEKGYISFDGTNVTLEHAFLIKNKFWGAEHYKDFGSIL